MKPLNNFLNSLANNIKKIINSLSNFLRLDKAQRRRKATSAKLEQSAEQKKFTVEKAKFSAWPQGQSEYRPAVQELPLGYGEDKIVLQIRDPWWIHSYWEVTSFTRDKLKESFSQQFSQAKWVLRVYDVSNIIFNGFNAHHHFDISIGPDTNNWYINVSSGCSYCVDLGLILNDGKFILILRSNTVTTPLDQPSWVIDEEWMIPDEEFYKMYGFGPSATSPFGKRRKRGFGEFISSPGFIPKAKK
jgi:hypothetical protein